MSQLLPDVATDPLKAPLSVEQRLEVIAELWDGIPDSTDALPVPEWPVKNWSADWEPPTSILTPPYRGMN